MANSPQARKRHRQTVRRTELNRSQRSMLRTHLKKVVYALRDSNLEAAKEAFKQAVPVLDRFAGKGLLHANTAARYKSRLNARIKKLAA